MRLENTVFFCLKVPLLITGTVVLPALTIVTLPATFALSVYTLKQWINASRDHHPGAQGMNFLIETSMASMFPFWGFIILADMWKKAIKDLES